MEKVFDKWDRKIGKTKRQEGVEREIVVIRLASSFFFHWNIQLVVDAT